MIGPAPLLFLLYRITAHCQAFCPQKPPLTEGKVSTGVGGDVVFRWELLQPEPDGSVSSLGEGGLSAQQTGGKLTFAV